MESESILTSIKKLIGMTEDYDAFDTDIIIHINSVFMILNQLGVGPSKPFRIIDKNDLWAEFLSEDDKNFDAVKTYVYLKTKIVFDPPSSSIIMQAMKEAINELEWRLNDNAESELD